MVITEDTLLPTREAIERGIRSGAHRGKKDGTRHWEYQGGCKIGSVADKNIADEDIETYIVTKEVYQKVFRSQQQKALRDASALARASLKQVP